MKRITDLQGYFLRDDEVFNEETEIGLDVEASQGLYRQKWNGSEWVECLSAEEISAMANQPSEPSIEDRVVTLEETVEVLFL